MCQRTENITHQAIITSCLHYLHGGAGLRPEIHRMTKAYACLCSACMLLRCQIWSAEEQPSFSIKQHSRIHHSIMHYSPHQPTMSALYTLFFLRLAGLYKAAKAHCRRAEFTHLYLPSFILSCEQHCHVQLQLCRLELLLYCAGVRE